MARRNQRLVVTVPQAPGTQLEASLAQAALEADTNARAAYVAEFKTWEEALHAGLWGLSSESENVRTARLNEAQSRLDSLENGPRHEVESMAEELERKLREMIAALRGDWRGRTLQAASGPPPLTASTEKLSELLRPVPVAERRILFCGKVESVLQAFNDPKTALVKSIGDKQLARMAEQAEGFSRHARALGHHFLLSQVADSELRADIDAAIVANAELVARLTALISGACENSLRSLLEANGNQLRNQFTFACAVACLKVYGNVSVAHLRTLLGLKHLGYLAIQDAAYRRSPDGQADLKRMGRQIDLALSTVRRQASKDHPPIERILALFEVNPALGRRPERRRPRPTGSGPEDQTFPSTDGSSDW